MTARKDGAETVMSTGAARNTINAKLANVGRSHGVQGKLPHPSAFIINFTAVREPQLLLPELMIPACDIEDLPARVVNVRRLSNIQVGQSASQTAC